jgi:hybrid cluster-associated redox disulfide protein
MNTIFDQDMTVEQLLAAHPELAHTFIQLKLDCVGCYLERFCTLRDIAQSYSLDLEMFMNTLATSIAEIKMEKK